jgi:hypothetical protein
MRLASESKHDWRTHNYKEDGQHREPHELDGFSTNYVDQEKGRPVTGNEASDGENQVANTDIPQISECAFPGFGCSTTEANGFQNDTGVKAEPVESDLGELFAFSDGVIPVGGCLTSRANHE